MSAKKSVPKTRRVRTSARYLRMLLPFMGRDPTRYYLKGIKAEPHPKRGILLVATDGHRMGIVHDEAGESNGDWINRVPGNVAATLRTKAAEDATCLYSDNALYITKAESELPLDQVGADHLIAVGSEPIDGTFPDWTRAVPRSVPDAMTSDRTFKAGYLADFGDVGKGAFGGYGGITLYRAGPEDPCIVRVSQVPEFLGILMPQRAAGMPALPDWLELPELQAAAE